MLILKNKSEIQQVINSMGTDNQAKQNYHGILNHFGTIDIFCIVGDPQEDPNEAIHSEATISKGLSILLK